MTLAPGETGSFEVFLNRKKLFSKHTLDRFPEPNEVEEKIVAAGTQNLLQLLVDTGLASSKGEARRLIEQGGVKVNGEKATAANADIDVTNEGVLLQVGKRRFLKVKAS